MHFHAFRWVGSGLEMGRARGRRPAQRDPLPFDTEETQQMLRNAREAWAQGGKPPIILSQWLLRPQLVRDTFHTAGQGVTWLRAEQETLPYAHGADAAAHRMRYRAANALETLTGGRTVSWGWYLAGRQFASLAVVSCSPNNYDAALPCPLPR